MTHKFNIDSSWTLFLDRDGVINQRKFGGYILSPEEFIFLPFVFDGLKRLSKQFSKIVIVTNQQGVGKGLMSQANLERVHDFMLTELKNQEIDIHKIYVATNLKDSVDDRRKPNPIMGWEAQKDHPTIQFEKSVMVGDTDSDIQFGKNLGMKTVLIKSEEIVNVKPDITVSNLKELADEFEL